MDIPLFLMRAALALLDKRGSQATAARLSAAIDAAEAEARAEAEQQQG